MRAKLRPYLEEQEITHVIGLLDNDIGNPLSFAVAAKLKSFMLKYSMGAMKPAYISTRQSVEESIGMVEGRDNRESIYNKWKHFPQFCTPIEISQAKEFAYEKDLLPSQESEEYEAELMRGFTS